MGKLGHVVSQTMNKALSLCTIDHESIHQYERRLVLHYLLSLYPDPPLSVHDTYHQPTSNNGQWTPTPTSQYYDTNTPQQQQESYYSTWYPVVNTVYSTSTYCYTYPTTIITITSIIPCPVTSYTTTYICGSCQTTTPQCEQCDPTTDYTTVFAGGSTSPTQTITTMTSNVITSNQAVVSTLSSYTDSGGTVVVVVTTIYPSGATQTTNNVAQSNVQVIYASTAGTSHRMTETAGLMWWAVCVMTNGALMILL